MKKIVIIGDSIAAGLYEGAPSTILDDFVTSELAGMGYPGYQVVNLGRQLEAFAANIAEMIGKFDPAKVIVMGLGIVDQEKKPNADPAVIQEYNDLAKKTAIATGAKFIDMYHHEMVYPEPMEFISEDGLHPSKFGYHLYGGLIARDLKNKLNG